MAVTQDLPGKGAYYTRISIGPYERKGPFELSTLPFNYIYNLPLPTELRDDTTVSYSSVNLETVGDLLSNRGNAMTGAVTRNAGQLISGGLSATAKGFGSAADKRGLVAKVASGAFDGLVGAVQSLLPAEQINSAIQQLNGVAPNPNPSVQFQGPVLRDFTLTWAFYPKNAAESDRIDKVIRKLKARALPSFDAGGGAILKYPHICQLNFFPWDEEGSTSPNGWSEKSIIKIKKCFMSGVNVNYNAFGTPGFFEGTQLPISYQLTISFKEIDYLLSGDWDDTAVNERVNSNTAFNSASALAQAGRIVVEGAVGIVGEIITVGGDFITGNYTTAPQDEASARDRARTDIEALTPPRPRETQLNVTFTKPGGTGRIGNYTYIITKNKEGQFVLNTTYPSTGGGGDGPRVTPDPTTRNFDSFETLDAYLEEEKVLQDGTQTNPPLPKAAAAAV